VTFLKSLAVHKLTVNLFHAYGFSVLHFQHEAHWLATVSTFLLQMWFMTWEGLFSSNGFYVSPEHISDCATTKQYKTLSGNLSKIIVI